MTPQSGSQQLPGSFSMRPEVVVSYHKSMGGSRILREVALGMEEEGIPCRLMEGEGDADLLGRQAAEQSPLKVGVGLDREGTIVLHHQRLHLRFPLFRLQAEVGSPERVRGLGANAARLVKGIPFKDL
ncbi:hypothetical protein SY88_08570 [Clostridiales bacterium PH28_bin88]|nr:hypothetical protein SY88_08570 [Clostridiales bacterium PH28_bin88]